MKGFSFYRNDESRRGGGILLYVREDMQSNKIKQIAGLFIENLLKIISTNLQFVSNALLSLWDRVMIILLGNFNVETEKIVISNILYVYNLKNLVKRKKCFKIQKNHMYRLNSD